MSSVIMLSKQYNPKKLSFPVYVSEKLDGVAAEFYVPLDSTDGKVLVRSRQNKPILSVQHICDELQVMLLAGDHIIGELYIPHGKFKDTSGKVRSHDPQIDLTLRVYDFYMEDQLDWTFKRRIGIPAVYYLNKFKYIHAIPHDILDSKDDLDQFIRDFFILKPEAEGLMIRSHDHLYEPGKRSWGMMKLKQRETVDLEIVDIEEATDEAGNPKGMAGGFKCKYKGKIIGVGPGKLSHPERIQAFRNRLSLIGSIVEVQYMPDPSYDSLREPTVVRFRDDKDEPNEEV